MQVLQLFVNGLHGPLPQEWLAPGAWPRCAVWLPLVGPCLPLRLPGHISGPPPHLPLPMTLLSPHLLVVCPQSCWRYVIARMGEAGPWRDLDVLGPWLHGD